MNAIEFILRPAHWFLFRLSARAQLAVLAIAGIAAIGAAHWAADAVAIATAIVFVYLLAAIASLFIGGLNALHTQLRTIRDGDLVHDTAVTGCTELVAIGAEAERLTRQLSQMVALTRSESQLISMSGELAARQAQALANRTESQAANLQQTRASLQTLVEAVRSNAEQIRAADEFAGRVRDDAAAGQASVQTASESIRRIEQRSSEMGEIISVINGISFQTNILALNAAVEAARAGDSGRGFAVVASEVRTLAQRSAKAAAEVKELIERSADEVKGGVRAIDASRKSLDHAVAGVRDVADRLRDVTSSSNQQSAGLQEIAQAVESIDDITRHFAQMVDGSVEAADGLRLRAEGLSEGVKTMRLRQGCADEAKAMAERAVRLIESVGLQEAARQFHDPKGSFRDRDMYIVVADRSDYFRAFGADPTKAGRLRNDCFPGDAENQRAIRDASWKAAEAGGGWFEFRAPHPLTKRPVQKVAYVLPAQDVRFAVQCSVNRGDGLALS
jgi:methyl-accepting chemotaxis protein